MFVGVAESVSLSLKIARTFACFCLLFSARGFSKPEPAQSKATASASGFNTSTPGFLDLLIELRGAPATETIDDKVLKFSEVCQRFGKLLTKNNGLWGTGPFQSARCQDDKKNSSASYQWKLVATAGSDSTSFQIFYQGPAGRQALAQSEYKIKSSVSPLKLMNEPRYATLIAAYLSFGLPFRSVISAQSLKIGADLRLLGTALPDVPAPTEPLEIFTLRRSGQVWQMTAAAHAENVSGANPQKWIIRSIATAAKDSLADSVSKDFYFIHQATGREATATRLDDTLKYDLESLLGKILGVARSAYIGGRFGMPMGKGEGVFAKAPLIGFFGEFRGGLLAGMHLYYDVIPKQSFTGPEYSEDFSLSRFQTGYGFGRSLDSSIINWIDVMPKLGVTTLDLSSKPNANSTRQAYTFKLGNAPTVGVEFGAEKRTKEFLARFWAYGTYSLGVAVLDKKVKTTSLRFGFDLYRELMNLGPIKIAALGFSAADSTLFKKTLSAEELTKDGGEIDTIKYHSFFLGGGIAMTW